MKYFLVIGIKFQKYKKPCNLRVFKDTTLIDDFNISKQSELCRVPKVHMDLQKIPKEDREWYQTNWYEQKKFPSILKIYEIDMESDSGSVRIEVKADDNNYTNGFMTKSALFGFPILALFPKKMTHDKNRSLAEILWKFYNARRKARISGIERIDNLFNWPNIIHFKVKDKDTNITNETTTYDTIGGNFIIEIPYSKKHNINVLKEPASRMNRGFFNSVTDWSVLLSCHKALLNTYNEDQRSNHA